MTAFEALAIVTFIVAALVGMAWMADRVLGLDPDLYDPTDEPMCVCGQRGGAKRHVHPSWWERR